MCTAQGRQTSPGAQAQVGVHVDLTAGTTTSRFQLSTQDPRIQTPEGSRVSGQLSGGPFAGATPWRSRYQSIHRCQRKPDARTQSVELDISTPQGQAAYQNFLETGQLPTDHPSARNAQSVETLEYNHTLTGQLRVGQLSMGGTGDTNGLLTIQETPQGTSYRYQGDARPENSIDSTWTVDGQGNPQIGETTLRLGNQESGGFLFIPGSRPADGLLRMAGQPTGADNVNLHMNEQGLQELRNGAIAHTRELAQHHDQMPESLRQSANDPNVTNEQWFEQARPYLGTNPYESQLPIDPVTDGLLRAQTPHEIATSLARMPTLDQSTGQLV